MKYTITPPERLGATIQLPASKSISNRAIVISALAGASAAPDNLSDCDDTRVMTAAMNLVDRRVAAAATPPPAQANPLAAPRDTIDIGAAGTAMRFLTAYLAVTPVTAVLTGTPRMCHRPIKVLVDALRRLGAHIRYLGTEGYPPLLVEGRHLAGGTMDIPGDVSSQYISALLMIAPTLDGGLRMRLTGDVISRPYIDLTLCMMRDFGARAEWTSNDTITVAPGGYSAPVRYTIESDWSAASYWYEAVALSPHASAITLTGLHDGSLQGDSAVRYLFSMLGVRTTFGTDALGRPTVTLRKTGRPLPRLEYDFSGQPDIAQTLVATCAALDIPFSFAGLATLKIKETDRIEALKTEMRKLGYVIAEGPGHTLAWNGGRCTPDPAPVIDTCDDHRMAMAFAPLAIVRPGLTIDNPLVVTKSYPRFWDDMRRAGFAISTR